MALFGVCVLPSPHRNVHTHHILPWSFSLPVCSLPCSFYLITQSTWWHHSWQSATLWFSALHCDNQSQSRDWTTSPSQPTPQALVQTSTPTSSTIAASQLPHTSNVRLNVSTQTSVLSLDAHTQTAQPSSTLLWDASTQAAPHSAACTDASTQLSTSELLQRCLFSKDQSRLFSNRRTSASSTVLAVIEVTVVLLQSHMHSPPGCAPPPGLEEQNVQRFAHSIPSKAAPVRPVQAQQSHVSTSQVGQQRSPEKECWYRPCGNPPRHQCRGP